MEGRLFARTDNRRMMLALMIAIAVIAAAIPTCQMIGCEMNMAGGMMKISTVPGASISMACDGYWVTSTGQDGIAPTLTLASLIGLIAVVAAALALFSPRLELRPVRLVDANGPPPPLEPRGERFTV
jgi:hypothetical protein